MGGEEEESVKAADEEEGRLRVCMCFILGSTMGSR